MTIATPTATLLPRREHRGPADDPDRNSVTPVVAGYDSAGHPSGALFLLAYSEFTRDFEWSLHPHERLEILTLAVAGTMRHYDTATDQWFDLHPGDIQLMRSGPGISHIEHSPAGTRGFQIQFDPGADIAAAQTPSYTDHRADDLPTSRVGDATVTNLVGGRSPTESRTQGLRVRRVALPARGHLELPVGEDRYTIAYLIDGQMRANATSLEANDAVTLGDAATLTAETADKPADLLVISLPAQPDYEVGRRRSGERGPRR